MGQSPEPGRWTPPIPASSSACWPATSPGSKTTAAVSRPWPARPASSGWPRPWSATWSARSWTGRPPTPLHVAVVGGAGAGKSTVVNFLVGAAGRRGQPPGRLHPAPDGLPAGRRLVGLVRTPRLPGSAAQARPAGPGRSGRGRLPGPARCRDGTPNPLGDVVVWDCPDMTTWAAGGYVPRLIEVAALADVVVYVASDERYNDEVPTQFLHLLVRAGKAVVVVLTKMAEAQAGQIVEHFQARGDEPPAEGRLGPAGHPGAGDPPPAAGRARRPDGQGRRLPHPAHQPGDGPRRPGDGPEADRRVTPCNTSARPAASCWTSPGRTWPPWTPGGASCRPRGRSSTSATGPSSSTARASAASTRPATGCSTSWNCPGAGRAFAMTLFVLRLPYRGLRSVVEKALDPAAGRQRRRGPGARRCVPGLDGPAPGRGDPPGRLAPALAARGRRVQRWLTEAAGDQFHALLRSYQLSSAEEIEAAARSVTAGLETEAGGPCHLAGRQARAGPRAIGLAFWAGGLDWPTIIYIFLFVSAAHQVVELIVRQYVEGKRSAIRSAQDRDRRPRPSPGRWPTGWPGGRPPAGRRTRSSRRPSAASRTRSPSSGGSADPRLRA